MVNTESSFPLICAQPILGPLISSLPSFYHSSNWVFDFNSTYFHTCMLFLFPIDIIVETGLSLYPWLRAFRGYVMKGNYVASKCGWWKERLISKHQPVKWCHGFMFWGVRLEMFSDNHNSCIKNLKPSPLIPIIGSILYSYKSIIISINQI